MTDDSRACGHRSLQYAANANGFRFKNALPRMRLSLFDRTRLLFASFGSGGCEDDRFEKAVAGQAVCAVNSGARDFAGSIKAGNTRFAVEIGDHATAGVVLGGHNRDPYFIDLDANACKALIDGRKLFFYL